jgi:hypothetical protein
MLPSPLDMTNEKVEHLICSKMKPFSSLPKETQMLKKGTHIEIVCLLIRKKKPEEEGIFKINSNKYVSRIYGV